MTGWLHNSRHTVQRTGRRTGKDRAPLLVLAAMSFLLAGCMTARDAPGPQRIENERKVEPLKSLGLLSHHIDLALGRHAGRVGPAAEPFVNAVDNVRRACSETAPSVTWLGHASAIINLGGQCVLTDPVLVGDTSAASPLPKRLVDSPVGVHDLPWIDLIILSHGDYDHLHTPTIRALAKRFPGAEVLVPAGVAGPVRLSGFARAQVLRQGYAVTIAGLKISARHAYHETRRTIAAVKTGAALSWILADGQRKVLFIGDSAYGPAFADIGRAQGPFDVVLVPIGAYEPRELVAQDVRARLAIGIHWGTFALSPDRPQDAVRRFRAAGFEAGIAVRIMKMGERIVLRR